jgi:mRNA interferase MazF
MSAPEEKEFDRWNDSKKLVDQNPLLVDFHEREIWWCSIGVNIGSEQHSQSKDFSRPVLVVIKFNRTLFLGIPLTTKVKKDEGFRFNFSLNGVDNDALILQMRSFDSRRLISKIEMLSEQEFQMISSSVAALFTKNMKTPQRGVSEAEADVCTQAFAYMHTRSIEEQRLLSRFYGDIYWNRLMIASR